MQIAADTHPVAVKDDDGVSGSQVDAQTSCSGAQQEEKHLGVFGELAHLPEEKLLVSHQAASVR